MLGLSSMFSIHSTAQRRWLCRVHVPLPGAIIDHNKGLQLSYPRITPILSGAIWASGRILIMTGSDMFRGGFSGFEGKEPGRRWSWFFSFGPTVLTRGVFSCPYVPLLPGCIYIWLRYCCGKRRQCPHEQQRVMKRYAPPDIHGGILKPIAWKISEYVSTPHVVLCQAKRGHVV